MNIKKNILPSLPDLNTYIIFNFSILYQYGSIISRYKIYLTSNEYLKEYQTVNIILITLL